MINCIVAVSKNQGIGFEGQMPWPRLKGDLAWFKQITTEQVVIMGRKTWNSLNNKKLPNRINVVLSKNKVENCDLCLTEPNSCIDVVKSLYPKKEIFIIGGGNIYELFKHEVDRFYITEIDHEYHCDVFFDLEYVKKYFTTVKELATFNDPIHYMIREYTS